MSIIRAMPIPSPFHDRTSALSVSHEWRNWSGYLAAGIYETIHDREYYAIRNSAALIDVSPLFKYEISGPDAEKLVNRIFPRDMTKCQVGQVLYSAWCDDDGYVIDDGTIARLATDRFRISAADPNLAWFQDCAYGMEAEVQDVSTSLAALAIQGPNSREIMRRTLSDIDIEGLRYYRLTEGNLDVHRLTVTRTGYTGDLGYELWIEPELAEPLWDRLMQIGSDYGILPAGIIPLDIARIEAGLLLIDIDYISSRKALTKHQKSTPYDIGLGWTVDRNKDAFIGRKALLDIAQRRPRWQLVGLQIDWNSLEALFAAEDLAPRVAGRASRSALPVYKNGRQIGQATSHTFSPVVKNYIAIATLETPYARIGSVVELEFTVEYIRQKAAATIVKLPFFNPPRKRA